MHEVTPLMSGRVKNQTDVPFAPSHTLQLVAATFVPGNEIFSKLSEVRSVWLI